MSSMALIELSFADAVKGIEGAPDVPARVRSHWVCSLRQIAKALDKPMETIPARWTSVRFAIGALHYASAASTPKTLANHKSNARAALIWFAKEEGVPSRGAPFTPAWAPLRDRLVDRHARARLSSLMRFCSARRIIPSAVDEAVIEDYMRYRAETTNLASGDAARRLIARAWNDCSAGVEGWPKRPLNEPAVKGMAGPAWEDFPVGLRADVDGYLKGLTKIRKSAKGKRIRPCKASTIRTRKAELVAVARMAVRSGIAIDSLTSFNALLNPDTVERVIDAYWKGSEPGVYTIDLGWKLYSIARGSGCFDSAALERLDEIRASLEDHRHNGLTDKNPKVIRQVLSGNVWREVINLPASLMVQARSLLDHAPVKAAVVAQIAVAIALLTVAPIRLGNLVSIRLDENLIKPGGLEYPYTLIFPRFDVKNRVQLEFQLSPELTVLIDEYVHQFRPSLLRGSNDLWLFPGQVSGFKDAKTFSSQITERIVKGAGLRLTVHQFRHAAAAILLKHRPGEYELVKRLLGHRNIQTTIQFYCGLETMQANKIFGDIVRKEMKFDREPV